LIFFFELQTRSKSCECATKSKTDKTKTKEAKPADTSESAGSTKAATVRANETPRRPEGTGASHSAGTLAEVKQKPRPSMTGVKSVCDE
jgi:hypothetical protein